MIGYRLAVSLLLLGLCAIAGAAGAEQDGGVPGSSPVPPGAPLPKPAVPRPSLPKPAIPKPPLSRPGSAATAGPLPAVPGPKPPLAKPGAGPAPTQVAALPPEQLIYAAQGLALSGRESPGEAFIVFMTTEAEEVFEPVIEKVGAGWRYLFSSAVPSVCYLSQGEALVLHYSPWADVGLVTVWRQADDGPEIHDAELLPGDFLRDGPQGTFDLVPYWLREGARLPSLAIADAVDAARVAFADLCMVAPPGAFRGLDGLLDTEILGAAHLASTLMLGQAGPIGLRAYLQEPELAPISSAALPLLEALAAGEVPEALGSAEIVPASLPEELAEHEGQVPSFLAAVVDGELGFLFLRLPQDSAHFLSLAFALEAGEARLTQAHRLSYAAVVLERLAAEEGP